jgi:hypothetical protein
LDALTRANEISKGKQAIGQEQTKEGAKTLERGLGVVVDVVSSLFLFHPLSSLSLSLFLLFHW